MAKAIEAKDIIKNFGSGELLARVLKGITLDIERGEFVGLMGKSGAGKSTLLYQLSLLDKPTSGEVKLFDKEVAKFNQVERTDFRLENLGYIFQDYALVPELTSYENVALPLMMMGWDDEKINGAVCGTLERLGLKEKWDSVPSKLSGGQQQRVSIARAVAKNPSILFADEPTANLDNASSKDVIEALQKLHEEGQTIVMVTHEHDYTKYCNRVLWMDDGLITKEIEPFKGELE